MTSSQFYRGPEHGPFVLGNSDSGVLLIHGFPGTPRELRPLASRLAADGWTAHGLLLPGFGSDIATLARRTRRDWLEAAGKEWRTLRQRYRRAALVGYSFGATIVAALAARDAPDRLVLVSPWWRLGIPGEFLIPVVKRFVREFRPFRHADFDDPRLRTFLQDLAPDLDPGNPEVRDSLRRQLTIPTSTIDEIRRLGRQSLQALRRVFAPTLVIQARGDRTVPVASTRHLLRYPAGPLRYVELDGGHDLIRLERKDSEPLVAAILQFLAEGEPIIRS